MSTIKMDNKYGWEPGTIQDFSSKNYYFLPELNQRCEYLREFYKYFRENKKDIPHVKRPYAYLFDKDVLGVDMGDMFSNMIRFIYTNRQIPKLGAHVDSSIEGMVPGAINFPILNCDDNSTTSWWKIVSGEPERVLNAGGQKEGSANYTYNCKNCELELEESVSFQNDQVHLFNTSNWHSVDNNSGKTRMVFSFLFRSDLKWEDIVKEFS